MKKSLLFCAIAALVLCGCDSQVEPAQPIYHPTEEPEAVTNDFTLVKWCIGKQAEDVDTLLTHHGYSDEGVKGLYRQYTKPEEGYTKVVHTSLPNYASMVVKNDDYRILESVFKQWVREIRASKAYGNLLRSSCSLSVGMGTGISSFSTPEALLAALDTVSSFEEVTASFYGSDRYANRYELILDSYLKGVFMEINNPRAGKPSDDFTESDLRESDLRKHILISKVDYMTYQYKGFYALNVSGKTDADAFIPIVSEYQSPGDFGFIRLYYRNTGNLLLDGTIIWDGCGQLLFPGSFRAGLPEKEALPFPGVDLFRRLDTAGRYIETVDEKEMRHIWQSVSQQKEFRHYYGNSRKQVTVYLYGPSVGMFDPYAAYYLVFTEQ